MCDGNATIVCDGQGSAPPEITSETTFEQNTNVSELSAGMADPIVEQNTENSLDISNFEEYQDKLMFMAQELSEVASSTLQKLSSKQEINTNMCDLIESCGQEFRDLGRHGIMVAKDIKGSYQDKANLKPGTTGSHKPSIKRKSDGKYSCSVCGKEFKVRTSCYNHIKIHIKTEYVCPKEGCLYKCKSDSTFKEHTKYYHVKKKTVKCKS